MKIKVTFKDPDRMQDCVDDAFRRTEKPEGISDDEWHFLREQRASAVKDAITDAFMEWGEYLRVEFDVADDGTVSARVVPVSER